MIIDIYKNCFNNNKSMSDYDSSVDEEDNNIEQPAEKQPFRYDYYLSVTPLSSSTPVTSPKPGKYPPSRLANTPNPLATPSISN